MYTENGWMNEQFFIDWKGSRIQSLLLKADENQTKYIGAIL